MIGLRSMADLPRPCVQCFYLGRANTGQHHLVVDLNQHHLVFEAQGQSLEHLNAFVICAVGCETAIALDPPQGAAQQQQHTEGAGDELTPIETLHDVFPVRDDGFLTLNVTMSRGVASRVPAL